MPKSNSLYAERDTLQICLNLHSFSKITWVFCSQQLINLQIHHFHICVCKIFLQNNANLGPGQYNLKSFVDDNNSIHKIRHGRFEKMHEVDGKPAERIYSFTLSQNPRKSVRKLVIFFLSMVPISRSI